LLNERHVQEASATGVLSGNHLLTHACSASHASPLPDLFPTIMDYAISTLALRSHPHLEPFLLLFRCSHSDISATYVNMW